MGLQERAIEAHTAATRAARIQWENEQHADWAKTKQLARDWAIETLGESEIEIKDLPDDRLTSSRVFFTVAGIGLCFVATDTVGGAMRFAANTGYMVRQSKYQNAVTSEHHDEPDEYRPVRTIEDLGRHLAERERRKE